MAARELTYEVVRSQTHRLFEVGILARDTQTSQTLFSLGENRSDLWIAVLPERDEALVMLGRFRPVAAAFVDLRLPQVSGCGVVPDWRFSALGSLSPAVRREKAGSRARWSAVAAHSWYEWHRNGMSLPAWVAIILPLELLLLWVAGTSTSLAIVVVLGALLTPVVAATFAAASVSKTGESASDAYGLAPFIAARRSPMRSCWPPS